jgi:hypothetical protein
MQLTLNIDDDFVSEIKKEFQTENIENAIYSLFEQFKNRKEKKISSEINEALLEVKNGKTKPIEELLNEL